MDKDLRVKIGKAITILQEVLEVEEEVTATKPVKGTKADKKPSKKTPKVEEEEIEDEEIEEMADNVIEINDKLYNLDEMSVKDIKKLAKKEFDIEFDSSKKDQIIKDFVEYLEEEFAGDEDEEIEDEEIEEEDEKTTAEEYGLDELSEADLKEILEQAELSTKGKKQALIDRIVEAIEAGEIELDSDEEEEDEEDIEEDTQEEEVSEEVAEAMKKLEKDIRKKIETSKIKMPKIKEFLKDYYDGDAECSDCKGCSKEEQINCYVKIQKMLIDDDGATHELEEPYTRNGDNYCCGKELQELDNKNLYCEICGCEYCAD